MAEATVTAKELARTVGVDPKTLRRFLREHLRAAELDTPGQGGRYAFTKGEAKALSRAFAAWQAPKVKAASSEADDAEEMDLDEDDVDSDFLSDIEAEIDAAVSDETDDSENEDLELEEIDLED